MDSPEEVYRLLTATSTVNGQGIEVEERIGHPAWDRNIGAKFVNSLGHGSPQITLIRNLYRHADGGLSLDEVLEALKMGEPRQVGGVLSGLAKNAKKLGFKSPVEIERTRNVKGQRTYIYRLEPLFRAALEEMIDRAQPLDRERDLPEFRDYVRSMRAALFGFMEQGAALALDENTLKVTPRTDIYLRYLTDNLNVIGQLATDFYRRPITVTLMTPEKLASNARNRTNDAQPIRSGAPTPQIPHGAPVPPHLR